MEELPTSDELASVSHVIDHDEVEGWLAHSGWPHQTYHTTSQAAAQDIREFGVLTGRAASTGAWGQGFYTSSRIDPQYGAVSLRTAVRLRHALIISDPIDGAELIDRLLIDAGNGDDVRGAVQRAGYDGVVVHWPDGETWVVSYFPDQVKIVRDEPRDR